MSSSPWSSASAFVRSSGAARDARSISGTPSKLPSAVTPCRRCAASNSAAAPTSPSTSKMPARALSITGTQLVRNSCVHARARLHERARSRAYRAPTCEGLFTLKPHFNQQLHPCHRRQCCRSLLTCTHGNHPFPLLLLQGRAAAKCCRQGILGMGGQFTESARGGCVRRHLPWLLRCPCPLGLATGGDQERDVARRRFCRRLCRRMSRCLPLKPLCTCPPHRSIFYCRHCHISCRQSLASGKSRHRLASGAHLTQPPAH